MDSLIWTPHKSGELVKSFNMELAKQSIGPGGVVNVKGLWRGLVPHRIEFFTWFAILGKINTKQKLFSLGIIP